MPTYDEGLAEIAGDEITSGEDQLETIRALSQLQIKYEGAVNKLDQELKEAKKKLNDIMLYKLPDAMSAAGMESFVLSGGEKVDIKEDLTISVPKKRKPEIILKLRDTGHGDMITSSLTIDIIKGQDNMVGEVREKAKDLGLHVEQVENVNSGSLKKLLKEQMANGETVDLSFFGAFNVTKAVIKQ